jgi:hypothetical protein
MNHFDAVMNTDATPKKMWTAPKLQVAAAESTESGVSKTTEGFGGAPFTPIFDAPAS